MEVEIDDIQFWLWGELETMCAMAEPPLTIRDVLNKNLKRKPIAAMRAKFAKRMRELVGQRGQEQRRQYVYFPGGRPNEWEPVSFPVLGEFLNLHHSTLVVALRKLARQEAERTRAKAAKHRCSVSRLGMVFGGSVFAIAGWWLWTVLS